MAELNSVFHRVIRLSDPLKPRSYLARSEVSNRFFTNPSQDTTVIKMMTKKKTFLNLNMTIYKQRCCRTDHFQSISSTRITGSGSLMPTHLGSKSKYHSEHFHCRISSRWHHLRSATHLIHLFIPGSHQISSTDMVFVIFEFLLRYFI